MDIDRLLSSMTLDEKLAQLGCVWITALVNDHGFDADAARRELAHGIGHITRIGASTGLHPAESASLMNQIQRFAVEETRLGIPVVVHEESTAGYCGRDATVFPQAIGLASTWDEELVAEVAEVIRQQLVAVGARHTLAPVLDVARDPRWGRVEETYGEDPYLVGRLGTAYVRAIQGGGDLRRGVIATGKHFLGYALSEGGMNHAPVHLGPRELREVYAEPFAAVIRDAGIASIMNSYSSVDGVPCAGDASILDGLLRDELGFDGVVVADYYSVSLLITHHRVAADRSTAALLALDAGVDMELPALDCYGDPLKERVLAGDIEVGVIDRSVRRVLESKDRLGLFEEPYIDADAAAAAFDTPGQRAVARRAAAASIVLLTNDGVLPLRPDLTRVAVLGPSADRSRLLQGDYHYPAHAEINYERTEGDLLPTAGGVFEAGPHFTHHVTPLEAMRAAYGDRVVHAEGCLITGDDVSRIDDAAALARDADVAVVFVGGESGLQLHSTVGEFRDATSLALTGVQQALIESVIATGTPTVVVLISGRVHSVPEAAASAAALVQAWLPGEEGGNGIVDVLTGAVNPSGRLPVSMPRTVGQVPVYASPRAGGGRSQFYRDYTDSPSTPLFPFGHGLSYTRFEHGPLNIESAGTTAEPLVLSIEVRNVGDRLGHDVVQLTARDDVASVARPRFALVGFAKVALDAGEARTVRFTVHPSRLAFYDRTMRFVIEPGTFTFRVGDAQVTVDLLGEVLEHRQREVVATAATW